MLPYERRNLPVRLARKSGESLPGYIYRLCDANGHSVPSPVRSSLTVLYGKNSDENKRRAACEISKLVGPVPESDWPRWQDPHGWRKQSSSWVRSCSLCLREHGFHAALWELPLVHACPYHRIKLQDHCDCGKVLAWRGLTADWRCTCGISLKHLAVERADKGSLILSRVICTCAATGEQTGQSNDWRLDPLLVGVSLSEVYARAELLHKLDARFVLSQNARAKHPRFPGASTGRFFNNSQNDVQDHIARWINSLFKRGDDSPIAILPSQSAVARLVQFLRESTEIDDGSSATRADVLEAIQRHLVPTRWSATVLIRTAVDRELLRAWLQSFFTLTDRARTPCGDDQSKASLDSNREGEHQRKELRLLLTCLINSLLRGDLPSDYRRAALAWPPLSDFAGGSGEEWLAHIIGPLYTASLAHLRYLRECFDQGFEGGRDGTEK